MTTTTKSSSYHIFMLKCWPEHQQNNGITTHWRFSIEDPTSGQRQGFGQLDDLLISVRDLLLNIMAYNE